MSGATFEYLRALIVEDNAHMRALLRSLLSALGIGEICEAADGEQAFACLNQIKPDLVLTDLSMEPVDGIAFTQRIRNAPESPNPYLPVIMITGHTERELVLAARDAGVTEFLAKPITMQNLFLRIAETVDRPRPFVRCAGYFGPDRRRHDDAFHPGPWRRQADAEMRLEWR